jgi:D-aspartate ligase
MRQRNQEDKVIKPAVVLATHTMGTGVIRALGTMGVPITAVYYDSGDMGYLSKYVGEKIRVTHPETNEAQFISSLVEYASRFPGSLLIPTSDDTLTAVSKHKDQLEQHYIVACTEWEITRRYIEKVNTYTIAEAAGVPAPKTRVPRSEAELEECSSIMQYPCLVKPSQSHQYFNIFKTKMVQVHNFDKMLATYRQAADAGLEVMIQECIPGDDSQVVNYNSYFWDGEPLVEFTAQQIRKAPPEFGAPRVVISKEIPEVIEPGRSILRAMNFYGYSCTEFKKDPRDNTYKLMEVNGRHNRSTLLAVSCGINFPWLQYRHLVRGELPSPSRYRTGIYWISLERDLGYSLKYLRKERYSITQYLRPYLRKHVFDVLNWRDPKPFMGRCFYLAKRSFKGILPGVKRDLSGFDTGG